MLLLWAAARGAPTWFIVVLAVAWVVGFASGRTDRLTVFLLCLPLCWAWGIAWSSWSAAESMCLGGSDVEGRHWWPPYVDCENGNTVPGSVEVPRNVFFGPFVAGVIVAGAVTVRGNFAWRLATAVLATLLGTFAAFV